MVGNDNQDGNQPSWCRENVLDPLMTVTVQREAFIVNYKAGTVLWISRFFIFVYVISNMYGSRIFLEKIEPSVTPAVFTDFGSFDSGKQQTYIDPITGYTNKYDVKNPHYCHPPYTDDVKWNGIYGNFSFNAISCARVSRGDIETSVIPAYDFLTTMIDQYRYVSVFCNEDLSVDGNAICNSGNAWLVTSGMCRCSVRAGHPAASEWRRTYYTVNPEGLEAIFKFYWKLKTSSGSVYSGTVVPVEHILLLVAAHIETWHV